MDNSTPKIRFGITPGTSARISEQEHKTAEPLSPMQIKGGTSARKAEAEASVEARRPYGVTMQARTGKPCTLAELMEAEAASRRGHGQQSMPLQQSSGASEERAQDTVRTTSFRPVPTHDHISATAGEILPFAANPASANEETLTAARSPFQTLRSLFSRLSGMERREEKQSNAT